MSIFAEDTVRNVEKARNQFEQELSGLEQELVAHLDDIDQDCNSCGSGMHESPRGIAVKADISKIREDIVHLQELDYSSFESDQYEDQR